MPTASLLMDQERDRLRAKLNHFLRLKEEKNLSLNAQIAAHPDFHAPDMTESLVKYLDVDPWGTVLEESIPPWEKTEPVGVFDYAQVAAEQRAAWEAKTNNPALMKRGV